MAIRPDWTTGTLTLVSGSVNFTTTGSALETAAVQAGDEIFTSSGHVLIIEKITGQNSGTLYAKCPAGAAGAGQALRIRYQPDGSRYQGAVRDLVSLLSGGQLQSLAGLSLEEGDYIRALGAGILGKIAGERLDQLIALAATNGKVIGFGDDGSGTKSVLKLLEAGVADPNETLKAFAGVKGAADYLPFYTGPKEMNKAPLSEFARTIIGRSNGGQIYNDLGIVPEAQIPERIRDRISTNITDCNAAVQSGWYYVGGAAANRPSSTSVVGMMLSLFQLPAYGTQIFYDRQDGTQSYRRVCVNGVWSSWAKLSLADFSQSISGNGWSMLPNGKYEQWGTAVVTLNASFAGSVTLPTAFPNNHFTSTLTNGDWGVAAARQASLVLVGSTQPRNQINFAVSGLSAPVTMRVNFTSVGN